ncbi:MAG TPA: leucyl aminopeptidase [Chromatiaceae bacterium]|nr:leucyl aminopeptidase [Chromatiaceae bacterium]HIN82958.1 leucyl aminopeptidase [Chromatiales bacterium]HIO54579.1 leucyl aminopeptidase [Chromatiales bacterium]
MKYAVKVVDPRTQPSDCLVLAIAEKRKLSSSAEIINKTTRGALTEVLKLGDISGTAGSSVIIPGTTRIKAKRILLAGCGDLNATSDNDFRKMVSGAIKACRGTGIKDLTLCLTEVGPSATDLQWRIRQIVATISDATYQFDATKSKKSPKPRLTRITIVIADKGQLDQASVALQQAEAIANGVTLTRDVSNLPGNICTPTYLAEQAKELGKKHAKLKVSVLGEKQMEALGMESLLSVSKGSREPAKLITMEYRGGDKGDKPAVLVGKGLTFDAGGISIKPSAGMDEMKYDMCGGASVLGTLLACAEMDLPINVVGVIPSSENLPDGAANKPGDIVTSMAGLTIEILNTDAEGRLILCDALTFCERYNPDVVVDIATLTGACVVALGAHACGLLSNDPSLTQDLLAAGEHSHDRAWQLPLWEEYQSQLDSNFADIANIGGKGAGTITAACFLSRFTEKYQWAHLDVAGVAWKSGAAKGATGRPVPLLSQFLIDRAGV